MSQEGDEFPNKPQDTDFKQQKLKAWQPILTPRVVIVSFLTVGVVFVVIGWVLDQASKEVVEYRVRYDGHGGMNAEQSDGRVLSVVDGVLDTSTIGCVIEDDLYNDVAIGAGTQRDGCFVEFTIQEDMEETVYVYYELDNFFQNHRRYVGSRSDAQLKGEDDADTALCDPLRQLSDLGVLADAEEANENPQAAPAARGSDSLVPCGLIAYSLFNDTIGPPMLRRGNEAPTAPRFTYDGIAWESDVDNKFSNFGSAGTACTNEAAILGGADCYEYPPGNYYLYEAYPFSVNEKPNCECEAISVTQECLDSNGNDPSECCTLTSPVGVADGDYYDCGCADCPFPGKDTFGVESENFIVWMRTAGLPNFRKLYMKIEEDLRAGDTLRFQVKTAFPVGSFEGRKSLVISTVSNYGGKNDFLGIAYIVVGSLCLVFGAGFFVKDRLNPRKLGDPDALNWKKEA